MSCPKNLYVFTVCHRPVFILLVIVSSYLRTDLFLFKIFIKRLGLHIQEQRYKDFYCIYGFLFVFIKTFFMNLWKQIKYLQTVVTQYFVNNKSEIWS